MILSIVTGTYQRRESLARMVESARRNIPAGLDYEFVLVDGGSTDGTLTWARQQPDVVLIEQGELLGAIRAFDAGAQAARGEYVLLANDDVEFTPGSIVPALTYLETHAQCGAVAFQDNRPAPGYGEGFKTQLLAVQKEGREQSLPYAQVGLFRRWLGELCGWWGSADAIMGQGHTYGGDNFLSARIYEYGYHIAALGDCRVTDHLEGDELRDHNTKIERANPGQYYKRYPTPPVFGSLPAPENPQTERLRVLYLPLYEPHYGKYKRGLREALQRVGLVWEVDYQNETYDLPVIARQFQPHLLLMQAHSPDDIRLDKLAAARAEQPGMVVVNWNGDVYEEKLISAPMLAYLAHVDLQLTVNADVLPVYTEERIPAAYWQIGYEPVDHEHLPRVLAHDVIFLANCYSESRRELGQALRSMDGVDVGLYGRNWSWGNGDTTYQFTASAALVQNAKIVIGDNQYGKRGYVSNRLFETLASGGFLLHQTVDGLEELTGLRDGVHYIAWADVTDLQKKIDYWLKPTRAKKRAAIAQAGQDFVRAHHSFDARVKELLLEIIPKVEQVIA